MKTRLTILAVIYLGTFLACLCGVLLQASAESELEACRRLAPKYHAELEHRLDDGTRVDMLTATEAIEADWARGLKPFEAIGQALYYSIKTNRQPAVLLLVTDTAQQEKYVKRCRLVCDKYHIKLYVERATKHAAAAATLSESPLHPSPTRAAAAHAHHKAKGTAK